MAQVSNPATLSSVKTVFGGGTPPNNLRSYLRGGGYVPNLSAYISVNPSGIITLNSLAGLIFPAVNLVGCSAFSTKLGGGAASITYTLNSSGAETVVSTGTGDYSGTWKLAGSTADYEVYFSGTGDTPSGITLNQWFLLSSSRSLTLSQGTAGLKEFNGTVQIRSAVVSPPPANQLIASAAISMRVEWEP